MADIQEIDIFVDASGVPQTATVRLYGERLSVSYEFVDGSVQFFDPNITITVAQSS